MVKEHFVEKGLGVQIDIHAPDKEEKIWHAHVLVTTPRFSEDGLTFEKMKARDLDPTIKKGFVVEADVWGELWRDLQNTSRWYHPRVSKFLICKKNLSTFSSRMTNHRYF